MAGVSVLRATVLARIDADVTPPSTLLPAPPKIRNGRFRLVARSGGAARARSRLTLAKGTR